MTDCTKFGEKRVKDTARKNPQVWLTTYIKKRDIYASSRVSKSFFFAFFASTS